MSDDVQRKLDGLVRVQRLRKAALLGGALLAVTVLLLSDSRWPSGTPVHETIEWIGIILMVIAILGRTWCSLYIGGRKVVMLVDIGPYSITRNPLYVLSVIGALGAGAQTGSIVMAACLALAVYLVFHVVIRQEEDALRHGLGASYVDYCARVPRFLPNVALWRDVEKLEIQPDRVRLTFFDGVLFLLAIPIAEGFEYLHDTGVLITLFRLP